MAWLPVLRDKYEENMRAARDRGMAIGIARGKAKAKARAKEWYERKQRAEQNGDPFNEPPPWEK